MKVSFKGIVKGSYSHYQATGLEYPPVMKFEGDSIHSVLFGLAIEEWTFVLRVNGRRIKNVVEYIKRQGLDLRDYRRPEVLA